MAGLENILELISARQQEAGDLIISSAEKKAEAILADGRARAEKEYEAQMKKYEDQLEQDLKNNCSAVDSEMRSRLLSFKVSAVEDVIEKTLKKLNDLPADEYFKMIGKILESRVRAGNGVLSFGKKDLNRIPDDFRNKAEAFAKKAGGTLTISETAENIENGFILSYGLISENCSFRAIIEAERDGVKDTAARALFG